MRINVTWNTDEDEEIAGAQSAKKAVLDLMETKIAIMFSSAKYDNDKLLAGAKTILGTAPIIGCTSGKGIITPDGYITSENGFVGIMAIGDENTTVATAICEKQTSARETGKNVARKAIEKIKATYPPNYFMMLSSPGDEEEYLKGIQDVIGDTPFFGGVACDDDLAGKWKIYTEEKLISDGVAVAFFYTDKNVITTLENGYHETVNSGVITRKTGKREINEIDGMYALKKYAEWTDKRIRNLTGIKLLEQSILEPLAVKTHDGSLNVIKQPLNGNTNFGINVANDIAQNMAVIQMHIEEHEIISAPSKIVRKINFNNYNCGFLLLQNVNRRNIIKNNDIDKMCNELKKEAHKTPYLVAFTNGECGKCKQANNICTSLSISATNFTNEHKKI